MHLDHTHHGVQLQTVQRRLAPVGGPGPVERVLGSYPPVRGAAFGPRADASGDVDSLLRFAAGVRADIDWHSMGARTPAEARASILGTMRRTLGIGVQRLEVQPAGCSCASTAQWRLGASCLAASGCSELRMRSMATRWPTWRMTSSATARRAMGPTIGASNSSRIEPRACRVIANGD